MLLGGLVVGVPQTLTCPGTIEKSFCMWRPSQTLRRDDDAPSQTLSALHFSPDSQSEVVSHDLPEPDVSPPLSLFSPFSQVPDLHARPSPHSRSFSQLAPQPLVPPFLPHP